MSVQAPTPTPAAIAAATAALGGSVVPLNRALRDLGWPYLSRASIHARRLAGTLPVTPRRLGSRWVVFARDAATLFEPELVMFDERVPPPRRRPGRPRKVESSREENAS